MPRIKLDPRLAILLAFTALLFAPLTAPGYFIFAHDARHTVYFLQMFDAALRDGALYPRWAADMVFGYGYPVWLILAPLPYYLGELFHLLGFNFVNAVKTVDAVGLVASGLAMYLFASRILGKDAGLVAAVAYLFIPYHIVDLYVRGAQAEYLAFIFPPLVMWALYELVAARRAVFVPLAAFSYAALILTHAQIAVIFSPVIGAYVLMLWIIYGQQGTSLLSFLVLPFLSILLGLLLSATFLLPVALEQRYLKPESLIGGFFDFHQHFLNPSQLLSPFWGYGYAGINGGDQFSLQLGILPLFLAALAIYGAWRNRDRVLSAHLIFFGMVSLVAIALMLSPSAPLWDFAAPIIAFVQFPWRLLIVTALTLAFISGAALRVFPSQDAYPAALVVSLLLALAMFPNAQPQYTDAPFTYNTLMDFEVQNHELLGETIWSQQRPDDSPLVEQYRAGKLTQKAVVTAGNATVELVEHRSQGDTVRVTASEPSHILFYTRYFPGWQMTIDGETTKNFGPYGEQGLIGVLVPAGTHIVTTRFGDTAPRQIGAMVSLLSLIVAVVWLWRTRK